MREVNPLAQAVTYQSILKFSFPTIIMMICMGLYTIGDTIFVARFVNTDALSALNIVCPVVNLIVGVGTMLATGGNAIVAQKMGAGEKTRASREFTLIVCAGVVLGIIITMLGIAFLNQMIWRLGASEQLFPYCKDYLFILLLFTPASMLQILFQNFIVTAGYPGFGMMLSISAGATNMLLDYVFMGPFQMGIRGAALGTAIGYVIPATAGTLFFSMKKGNLYFQKPATGCYLLLKSCSNGCSEMVSQAASAVTTFLFNYVMMNLLGENGVAAVTIMIYTQFLLTSIYIGFSTGVAPIISYQYGRRDYIHLQKVFHICLCFIAATSVLIFLCAMLLGDLLVHLFSPAGTLVYWIARNGFLIFSFSFLFCGTNIFISAAFTALGNGKLSAILSFLRTFGLIAILLLLLPRFIGVTGVWLAVPAAELLTSIVAEMFLHKVRKSIQTICLWEQKRDSC